MAGVFLSYARQSRSEARAVARRLQSHGHKVWFDESALVAGTPFEEGLREGLETADLLILMLSSEALTSPWVELEWKTMLWDELESGRVRVIVALLEDCDIPPPLRHKTPVALFEDRDEALARLEQAVALHGAKPGALRIPRLLHRHQEPITTAPERDSHVTVMEPGTPRSLGGSFREALGRTPPPPPPNFEGWEQDKRLVWPRWTCDDPFAIEGSTAVLFLLEFYGRWPDHCLGMLRAWSAVEFPSYHRWYLSHGRASLAVYCDSTEGGDLDEALVTASIAMSLAFRASILARGLDVPNCHGPLRRGFRQGDAHDDIGAVARLLDHSDSRSELVIPWSRRIEPDRTKLINFRGLCHSDQLRDQIPRYLDKLADTLRLYHRGL